MNQNNQIKLTPLMQQYWEIKQQYPHQIVLFRMGDFYEMFHDDAILAAPLLNIALTSRNKKSGDETPMCGVPYHSISGPIGKLLAAGHKVALCDQVEDPKEAKGLVKRAVTRVLTPGVVYDPETLDQLEALYLASYDHDSISFLDSSTGEAFCYSFKNSNERERLLHLLAPRELILSSFQKRKRLEEEKNTLEVLITVHEALEQNLDSGTDLFESAERLLSYWQSLSGERKDFIYFGFQKKSLYCHLELSEKTVKHLEIFQNYQGGVRGSVFSSLNRTLTAMGGRLLKDWLRFPLRDPIVLAQRQDEIEFWFTKKNKLDDLRKLLPKVGDLERKVGKLTNPNVQPRDLVALADALRVGHELISKFNLCEDENLLVTLEKTIDAIDGTLIEDPPLQFKNGGFVRLGFSASLDELVNWAQNSQKLLLEFEERERKNTGIGNLKIRSNSIFGYYIEVTQSHLDKIPSHYLRKQTLTQAERFTTQELTEIERKILLSEGERIALELQIFEDLRKKLLLVRLELHSLSQILSKVDVISSLAWLALEQNYIRPQWSTKNKNNFYLIGARHPVLEQLQSHSFVANDIRLNEGETLLLTGPNMAGKSTLMRQVALISLYAQIGSFVPAREAQLPLLDKIMTRIGASDSLVEGLSTFMVEMTETADILKEATAQSLILFDEIGRGTSTYDGLSLAQAILEYMVAKIRGFGFFATHYHELTRIQAQYPQIKNGHMGIQKNKKGFQFLYTLCPGSTHQSFGVEVAKKAGLPSVVTQRAFQILKNWEDFGVSSQSNPQQLHLLSFVDSKIESGEKEIDVTEKNDQSNSNLKLLNLAADIQKISISNTTPLEALKILEDFQKKIEEIKSLEVLS